MTNQEDVYEEICDTRLAALMAVQIVRQVLDEAYVIANAATESDRLIYKLAFRCNMSDTTGQPWRCMSLAKHLSSDSIAVEEEEETFAAYKGDCEDNVSNHDGDHVAHAVTSTPQKASEETIKDKTDTTIIGQGDEEFEDTPENELNNSTAKYINNLFDMSDVERVIATDDNELMSRRIEPSHFLPLQDITKMMESYVNAALSMAFITETLEVDTNAPRDSSISTDYSGYSFLSDAFDVDEMSFKIKDGAVDNIGTTKAVTVENAEQKDFQNLEEKEARGDYLEGTDNNNALLCENAYLTLNRDYEQCSEEEVSILRDPKDLTMQEVELITANTSCDDLASGTEKKPNEMAATSAVSAVSRKSLVHRCRSQGARLLSCLRGWWRRKTPGKRREGRVSGSIRGICPLSPDARLRANSMLEQRRVRSPSPNRSVVWKFNTVNEALVNSSRWKEYTFDVQPEQC